MQFLPNVTMPCEVCQGKRYNREALEITLKDKNISEVLDMTVSEALEFFWNFPRLRTKLETLRDVGLGYIRLGQPATTLSGGEAQRVKLATELSRRATGKTLYILDEPTTGLSFQDCAAPSGRAAPSGGRRQHGRPHRAPPGPDKERRLGSWTWGRALETRAETSSPQALLRMWQRKSAPTRATTCETVLERKNGAKPKGRAQGGQGGGWSIAYGRPNRLRLRPLCVREAQAS